MTKLFTATASNDFYFMDLCVLAADEAEARSKFEGFIAAHEYADEEKEGGLYTVGNIEHDGFIAGWSGEPAETVQMTNSGCNG